MAREATAEGCSPALAEAASAKPELGPKVIFDLAMQGDAHAERIFRKFGRYLGIMLAGAVNVLNLEMYVIGGGVCSAWDAFAPSMFDELRSRSVVYAATEPADTLGKNRVIEESGQAAGNAGKTSVTRAVLGSDAGLYGAARAAMLESRELQIAG
jgi:glucokinase